MNSSEQPKEKLIIFDTTLRDGEQSPGASMTKDEKVRIAIALEKMRVDVIEAGFAISSQGDFEAIQAIARSVTESRICSLSRAVSGDIERAAEALKGANAGRIHTFIATSPIHMKHKLQMEPDQVLEQAVGAVKIARGLIDDVEFSLEDASRTEFDFMCRITEAVISAGARTINLPDTVGYSDPGEYAAMIKRLMNSVPNADKAIFSVHCHNDLGLAVANSLAAIQSGARQVECTVNGLGERAGNAALEELVMAIRTRQDVFPVQTNIDATHIVPTSRLVSSITGFPVQPNKAIVGANAFAHESGIHQDGILKFRETYEIMRAEDVGWSTNKLSLGKLSGRAALSSRLEELGIKFDSQEEFNQLFKRFKALADKKREIFDEDLQALVSDAQLGSEADALTLIDLEVLSKSGQAPQSKIIVSYQDKQHSAEASGDGAVDAIFNAIEKLVSSGSNLQLYSVNAVTEGTDSQGGVTVRLEKDGRIINGQGADTDILVASAKAYLNALTLMRNPGRLHPQLGGI
ncbi:2-isopropylmalate synthase [gamma proteobacterium HTCC2207]|jgi:2-isopropylmalate synthase|uniref:2-isopropylmalate synthase n=1 Tax=gamma proteobacterium HTCC2207 TaxID=314287 RepID=Q1YRP0_9GAMM|nr:2-isopropylmalate synthase [gamma proteobacterium HTCC2207]MDB4426598.1 2-isopropylmalate synthase [Porticoccaceae bacterium]MDC0588704.1 2-isopropylmalate synthase [Porticoccaceae bacterium]